MSQKWITKAPLRAWRSLQVAQGRTCRKTEDNLESVMSCSFAHGPESAPSLPQFSPACQPSHQPLSLALQPLMALLPVPGPLPALPHNPQGLPELSVRLQHSSLQFGGGGRMRSWLHPHTHIQVCSPPVSGWGPRVGTPG